MKTFQELLKGEPQWNTAVLIAKLQEENPSLDYQQARHEALMMVVPHTQPASAAL
jgi:hypothetical protein